MPYDSDKARPNRRRNPEVEPEHVKTLLNNNASPEEAAAFVEAFGLEGWDRTLTIAEKIEAFKAHAAKQQATGSAYDKGERIKGSKKELWWRGQTEIWIQAELDKGRGSVSDILAALTMAESYGAGGKTISKENLVGIPDIEELRGDGADSGSTYVKHYLYNQVGKSAPTTKATAQLAYFEVLTSLFEELDEALSLEEIGNAVWYWANKTSARIVVTEVLPSMKKMGIFFAKALAIKDEAELLRIQAELEERDMIAPWTTFSSKNEYKGERLAEEWEKLLIDAARNTMRGALKQLHDEDSESEEPIDLAEMDLGVELWLKYLQSPDRRYETAQATWGDKVTQIVISEAGELKPIAQVDMGKVISENQPYYHPGPSQMKRYMAIGELIGTEFTEAEWLASESPLNYVKWRMYTLIGVLGKKAASALAELLINSWQYQYGSPAEGGAGLSKVAINDYVGAKATVQDNSHTNIIVLPKKYNKYATPMLEDGPFETGYPWYPRNNFRLALGNEPDMYVFNETHKFAQDPEKMEKVKEKGQAITWNNSRLYVAAPPEFQDWEWVETEAAKKGRKRSGVVELKITDNPPERKGPDLPDTAGLDDIRRSGCPGIGYGSEGYMSKAHRSFHTRSCFAGLMDLADITNISYDRICRAIVGENLKIAFGSHGGGSAGAHFMHFWDGEIYNMINMTRDRGEGCLGHEWMHFVDGQLGDLLWRGNQHNPTKPWDFRAINRWKFRKYAGVRFLSMYWYENGGDFATSNTSGRLQLPYVDEGGVMRGPSDQTAEEEDLAREVLGAFYTLMYTFYNGRPGFNLKDCDNDYWCNHYSRDAFLLGKGYWFNTQEMLARAFEAYLTKWLTDNKRVNRYLVNMARTRQPYGHKEVKGRWDNRIQLLWPYPQDKYEFQMPHPDNPEEILTFEEEPEELTPIVEAYTEFMKYLSDYWNRNWVDMTPPPDLVVREGDMSLANKGEDDDGELGIE